MLPASNRGPGQNMGFPDVCLTPAAPSPVPLPYPNIAMNAQAVGFSVPVLIMGSNALNLGSQIPMTSGDEAGTAHPTFKGAARYTMGNLFIYIEKMPAIMLTAQATGNQMNCPLAMVAVPSAPNVLFTLRAEADAGFAELETDIFASTEMLPRNVLHLKVAVLRAGVGAALRAALTAEVDSLLIDLRGCPGGTLAGAVDLCSALLPVATPVARLWSAEGEDSLVRTHAAPISALPLVVLIDGRSASAAEIVAACLRDQRRGLLVGSPSFGKRRVQPGVARPVEPCAEPRADEARWAPLGAPEIEPHVAADLRDDDRALMTAWATLMTMQRQDEER